MGCQTSKPRETPTIRRRLSLSDIDKVDGEQAKEEVTDEDRTMLLSLSMQNILEYIGAEQNSGRKFSLGSQTDTTKPTRNQSFSDKPVELQGYSSKYDVQAEGIGYACKKGLKPEAPNQDSFLVLKVGDDMSLYGVFDGHGRKGHDVSNFIKDNFPKILFLHGSLFEDPHKAIADTFRKLQYLIEKSTALGHLDAKRSGSTASIVLHNHKLNKLYIAHVGDSRVVLAKEKMLPAGNFSVQSKDLTIDHKPDLPEERKRIEKAGGIVVFDGAWNHRVYARRKDKNGKSYPGLNMSRAMGDLQGNEDAGISAVPDVSERMVQLESDGTGEADKFLLLCSDGIWEFVSSSTAVQIANSFPLGEAQKAAEQLATIAWDHWVDEMNGEVVDDITCLVIHLKGVVKVVEAVIEPEKKSEVVDAVSPEECEISLPEPDQEVPLINKTKHRPASKASCRGWKI